MLNAVLNNNFQQGETLKNTLNEFIFFQIIHIHKKKKSSVAVFSRAFVAIKKLQNVSNISIKAIFPNIFHHNFDNCFL